MKATQFLAPSLLIAALAAPAMAGTWMERETSLAGVDRNHSGSSAVSFGDAGESLANPNITMGDTADSLNTITGTLSAFQRAQVAGGTLRSLDADLFCIHISDPAAFSAIASGTSGPDLNLTLFTANGTALKYNDNRTDSLTSVNPRLINNGLALDVNGDLTVPVTIPGLVAGDYLLAISRVDGSAAARRQSRPLDTNGLLMFPGMLNPDNEANYTNTFRRADLDPAAGATTLAAWELLATTAAPFNTNYTITLTGTTYCAIPTPGASALLGIAAVAFGRRRR